MVDQLIPSLIFVQIDVVISREQKFISIGDGPFAIYLL